MPRTRDLFLVGVIVLFFVSAIGVTWLQRLPERAHDTATAWLAWSEAPVVDTSVAAVLVNELVEGRANRLATMQERVAEQLGVARAVPDTALYQEIVSEPEDAVVTAENTVLDVQTADGGMNRCSNYGPSTLAWSPQGVLFQESEGVRVVFRETVVDTPASTSTTLGRVVLAQLPMRQFPLPTTQCLPTDVIGIAQDGSLIRNNELALYGIFGAQTVIGYALDGFPIHGANPGASVDACGGMTVDGQYRYYLDSAREGLINCFAGIPVTL